MPPDSLPDQRWLAGDRVHVKVATPYTSPGPGTLTGIDMTLARPFHVTLDDAEEPFDLIALQCGEFTSLASDEQEATA